jgi:hypothetical protein
MLTAFLGVGLVISTKIGGGNNLHNLDMFLIGLLITAGIAWEAGAYTWFLENASRPNWVGPLALMLVLFPFYNTMQDTEPQIVPGQEVSQVGVEWVQRAVSQAQTCGEVLFIDNRQLLTFGYIRGVPLIPDLLGDLEDALCRLARHSWRTVQRIRDRGLGKTGELRDQTG